jgi:hypothetical protein
MWYWYISNEDDDINDDFNIYDDIWYRWWYSRVMMMRYVGM